MKWEFLIGCVLGSCLTSYFYAKWFWSEKHQAKLHVIEASKALKRAKKKKEDPEVISRIENNLRKEVLKWSKIDPKQDATFNLLRFGFGVDDTP